MGCDIGILCFCGGEAHLPRTSILISASFRFHQHKLISLAIKTGFSTIPVNVPQYTMNA